MMANGSLQHLGGVDEITIGFQRPDGSNGSTPIWVVTVGDDVYVRSIYGSRGGWYRRLRARPDGQVEDGDHVHPVHAEPVADPGTLEEVTRAYATKYAGSPYVQSLLGQEAVDATLRLEPR